MAAIVDPQHYGVEVAPFADTKGFRMLGSRHRILPRYFFLLGMIATASICDSFPEMKSER